MSRENVELVRQSFEHQLATEEPMWAALAEHVEVHDHDIPDAGDYQGHSGVTHWLEDWAAPWAKWDVVPERFIDANERVVVFLRVSVTGHSGVNLERDDAMVYTVRDNLIARIDYYNNRSQALEAVGLSE